MKKKHKKTSKLKLNSNSIYIGKYDKKKDGKSKLRYVYYDKSTKKRITASINQFKDIREFKNYIQTKGYLYGSKIYNIKEKNVKIGKNVVELESKKLIKDKRFSKRMVGSCKYNNKVYWGTSSIYKHLRTKGRQTASKEDVWSAITFQILLDLGIIKVSDKDEIDELGLEEEFNNVYGYVSKNTKFSYIYIIYKD